jgi:hypothetical protein
LIWLRIGTSGRFLSNEPSGSIKYWEILEYLHGWKLLEKGTPPQN